MRRSLLPLLCCFVLALPNAAQAWGGAGHKVVCDIAWRELTDAAKANVAEPNQRDGYPQHRSAPRRRVSLGGAPYRA